MTGNSCKLTSGDNRSFTKTETCLSQLYHNCSKALKLLNMPFVCGMWKAITRLIRKHVGHGILSCIVFIILQFCVSC